MALGLILTTVIAGIHSTTILVSDQDAALRFYVDTLGWEKRQDNRLGAMRFLTVAPPGAQTSLVLGQPEIYGKQPPTVLGGGEGNSGISLTTPDLTSTYQELVARGVQFKQSPEKMPWGALATWFTDPFGNEFFLAED
jgi:catechol 2,3-dioxygenase-like lactoylglutathione lyase family enzyme